MRSQAESMAGPSHTAPANRKDRYRDVSHTIATVNSNGMQLHTYLNRRVLGTTAIAALLLTGAAACSDDTDSGVDTETTVDLDPGSGSGLPGDSGDETTTTAGSTASTK